MASKPAYLDLDDARILGQAMRDYQLRPRAEVGRAGGPRLVQPIKVALVTQAAPAATSAGPGKGKGRFVTVAFAADDTATYGDPEGDEFPLYTIDPKSPTPAGAKVIVGTLDGRFFILVEVCP